MFPNVPEVAESPSKVKVPGTHVGAGVGVGGGVGVGVDVGGVGVGEGPQLDSVSVVVTDDDPLYPPAAKRVFPMFVPATNERPTFSEGPLDQVLETGS